MKLLIRFVTNNNRDGYSQNECKSMVLFQDKTFASKISD